MKKTQNNIRDNSRIFEKYLNTGKIQLLVEEDKDFLFKLYNSTNQVYFDQEYPDIIINSEFNNLIFGIEHFEFNSSKETKKGSFLKAESAQKKSEHNIKVQNIIKEDQERINIITSHDRLIVNPTIEFYYNSFNRNINNHIAKITAYKTQIGKVFSVKEEKMKLGFLIEDTSYLGTIKKNGDLLYPFMIKEIVSKILNIKKINFVIFADYYTDSAFFVTLTGLTAFIERNELLSLDSIELADINPNQVSATVVIRDE